MVQYHCYELSQLICLQALKEKKVNPGPSSAENLPSSRPDYARELQEIMNTTWNSNGMPAMQEHGNATRAKTYTNSGRYNRVSQIMIDKIVRIVIHPEKYDSIEYQRY